MTDSAVLDIALTFALFIAGSILLTAAACTLDGWWGWALEVLGIEE